ESIFRSFGSGSDAKIYPVTSCFQTMRLKLSISGRLIDSKFTMHLADSLILAFSPHGRRDSLSCWERVRVRAVMVTAAILLVVPAVHARDVIHKGDVVVVPLRGEVSSSLLMFLRRAIKMAENEGASAVVFEMNTYGGRLDAAADIVEALNHITIPTYIFINTN